ncbi:MAG: peptidase domain protein [Bacteroidetes bacterium]|nr:peptidase domain protein [Bacteroidota bacterium]
MNRLLTFILTLCIVIPALTFGDEKVPSDNLILLPVKNDPTVSFRIWFKVGSQNDPAGKEGLASLTAAMLTDAATQKNSYEQVLDRLFPLASNYDANASKEMTVIYGRTHKDNLKEFYPLFTDAILSPAFKQEDLDRIKSRTLNYLENQLRYASDEELGKAVLYNTIFAGTPYGYINAGLIESVKNITLEDVKNFYKVHYTRDNISIGLGGGYDAALVDQMKKDLQQLPSGQMKQVPEPQPKPIKGKKVVIVEKDAASTAISIGFPINIVRGSKEWYALAVANSWLGQHRNSSSHLYLIIREERGLNYGDYSYIENFPNGGGLRVPPQNVGRRKQIFEIWIRPVPNETRHFALRAALREFTRLVDNGMTESDFKLTRGFLKKFVLHYAPTTMERLGYAIDDKFYAIKGSHLETFRKMMGEVTLKDVNAAIKKHWQHDNMQIAIVTKDAQGLKDALVNDTPSPITYTTTKSQHILDEDKEISSFRLGIKADDVTIVPVAELFVK